ncbi:AAA family ATPase [Thiothrix subterranea]|uniref:AAA family ATPase n=1 Tax=Thiothrix subterranea TaxID=2735563 RepID=UPI00280BDB30|nr:AAA family ATPase [Thiothrix subterranea]
MIQQISINGFKSIPDMTLELGRVNCFIGANGVGKSNILEAIGVLGAAANGIVDDEALLRRGVRPGLPRLYKASFEDQRTPVHIGLSASTAQGAEYRISILNPLENPKPAWAFKTEYLFDGVVPILSDGVRNKKNLNPMAGLAALKLVELDEDNPAFTLMQSLKNYSIYCPTRQPCAAWSVTNNHANPWVYRVGVWQKPSFNSENRRMMLILIVCWP